MPLRGAKTLPGFHPFANTTPVLAGDSAAGRQNTVMRRRCVPIGRAMPPQDGILPAMPRFPRPESEWYTQRYENPAGFSPPAGALRGLAGYRQGLSDTGP
ncbi:MAG: hypothetical protein LBK61_03025 [Spirochaetaceae bacterium]|nr:hypothetical protein [Spirochaetaceae bacterium]